MRSGLKTLLCATTALALAPAAFAQGHEVNVTSIGGAYQRSQQLGYGDAFEAAGNKINWNVYSGGLGEIRTQVDTGNVIWDLVDVNSAEANTGCLEGIFEKIDLEEVTAPAPDGRRLAWVRGGQICIGSPRTPGATWCHTPPDAR